MTEWFGLAWGGNAHCYEPVGFNQVAMTKLSALAWLGNAYIVASL